MGRASPPACPTRPPVKLAPSSWEYVDQTSAGSLPETDASAGMRGSVMSRSRRRGCGGWNARRAWNSQYGKPATLFLPQKWKSAACGSPIGHRQLHSVSVWMRADLKVIAERVQRRDTRPLLRGRDPLEALTQLAEARYPIYAQADLTVDVGGGSHGQAVEAIYRELRRHAREESQK